MWLEHIKLSFIKALGLLCQINSNHMIRRQRQILRLFWRLSTDTLMLQLMELLIEVLAEIILIVFCVLLQIHVCELILNMFNKIV